MCTYNIRLPYKIYQTAVDNAQEKTQLVTLEHLSL